MTSPLYLPRVEFQHLIDQVLKAGYQLLGPQCQDGAIVFSELTHVSQLPEGVVDEQAPACYRLRNADKQGGQKRWFYWSNGPQAIKPLLFRPKEMLWQASRDDHGQLQFIPVQEMSPPKAVLGIRACDLAALDLQDRHFLQGQYPDPYYQQQRQNLLLIAVNCARSADTCFCASTGDGPDLQQGFDIGLHELDEGFIVESASDTGDAIVSAIQTSLGLLQAGAGQLQQAKAQVQAAAQAQSRQLPDPAQLSGLDINHPQWQQLASECLSCGNCTSVCPSCFCHDEREFPQMSGDSVRQYRQWSSCFTAEHSYMHGITIREDTQLRYRQWFTHKLQAWHQQYGRSGCVGCGRCISWCPVGIDITEQARLLATNRES